MQAESVYQLASGPETTLDSIWAASGYMHTLTHTVAFQMDMTRLTAEKGSRLWGGGLASFGDASVRNDHPSFDYSAGGYAIGYDYSRYEGKSGLLAGLAVGQMFGHQNVKEMPDHPNGMIPGDRYRQIFLGADFYGAVLRDITPRSHLIFSLDAGAGYMGNKCRHREEWNDMSKWNTDTLQVSLSAARRYDVTESFSVMPFTRLSYTHASNKQRKDDGSYCSGGYYWDDDDDCDESHWDNRGRFENLFLEVGVMLEHTFRFSRGMAWSNSLSGSYCPDIVRKDPYYTFNDTWWEGETMYQSRYRARGTLPTVRLSRPDFYPAWRVVSSLPFLFLIKPVCGILMRSTRRRWEYRFRSDCFHCPSGRREGGRRPLFCAPEALIASDCS